MRVPKRQGTTEGGRRDPIGPTPVPRRKRLRDMSAAEFAAWLAEQHRELEDMTSYVQSYLTRRARRGSRTLTDKRYEQFLAQAADLLAGLAEMREAAEQAAQAQEEEDL